MLTDIFVDRYRKYPIFKEYKTAEKKLLTQAISLAKEVFPYYDSSGSIDKVNEAKWKTVHELMSRELGLKSLSQCFYSYNHTGFNGVITPVTSSYSWDLVCENFVIQNPPQANNLYDPDEYVKDRLSLIELIMRTRGDEISDANNKLESSIVAAEVKDNALSSLRALRVPGNLTDSLRAANLKINKRFGDQVIELNERFRRAGAPLTYHNGFIQVSIDPLIEEQIATPFWKLVANPLWHNVDEDMKEALDRRDSNDKDPAIFAARALESAIKIVSSTKNWTTGTEKGAGSFIDNLASKANGKFLSGWEKDILLDYFRKVRNPLGHGAGADPMPNLDQVQTDWAIETAMTWIRLLVRRLEQTGRN